MLCVVLRGTSGDEEEEGETEREEEGKEREKEGKKKAERRRSRGPLRCFALFFRDVTARRGEARRGRRERRKKTKKTTLARESARY